MFCGQRFELDLSSDEEDVEATRSSSHDGLIADIRERNAPVASSPQPPTLTSTSLSSLGFPAHKSRPSVFRRQRKASEATPTSRLRPSSDEEQRLIDQENRQRLAAMSSAQIERERAELVRTLPPSLIERLLRRANIDSVTPTRPPSLERVGQAAMEARKQPLEQILEESPSQPSEDTSSASISASDERPPPYPPPDLRPASETPSRPIHFPTPPPRSDPMPSLDPSSPSFLADLQTHYFPDTPQDPSALSWLQLPSRDPDDPEAASSAYHPASSVSSVSPAALRFSLVGSILSPSTSLSIPTSIGLHHHAKDPEAAGYTIPELAILSRSTIPAQRCIAWQVLGRILFRLGKGEFGERGSTLVEGLWSVVERNGVVARMLAEADGGNAESRPDGLARSEKGGFGRHASAKAWATEGIWLWRMGGGDRGILRESLDQQHQQVSS